MIRIRNFIRFQAEGDAPPSSGKSWERIPPDRSGMRRSRRLNLSSFGIPRPSARFRRRASRAQQDRDGRASTPWTETRTGSCGERPLRDQRVSRNRSKNQQVCGATWAASGQHPDHGNWGGSRTTGRGIAAHVRAARTGSRDASARRNLSAGPHEGRAGNLHHRAVTATNELFNRVRSLLSGRPRPRGRRFPNVK